MPSTTGRFSALAPQCQSFNTQVLRRKPGTRGRKHPCRTKRVHGELLDLQLRNTVSCHVQNHLRHGLAGQERRLGQEEMPSALCHADMQNRGRPCHAVHVGQAERLAVTTPRTVLTAHLLDHEFRALQAGMSPELASFVTSGQAGLAWHASHTMLAC